MNHKFSDFIQSEFQLQNQLKLIGYRRYPWNKNILYMSMPNSLDNVQMRCYFDLGDYSGASETYLLHENSAILLNPQFDNQRESEVLIVGVFESKLEFAVMKNHYFEKIETFLFDSGIPVHELADMFSEKLTSFRKRNKINKCYVINERNDNLHGKLLDGISSPEFIRDKDNLILSGLEIAAEVKFERLFNRISL